METPSPRSLFEAEIQEFEGSLEYNLGAHIGAEMGKNLITLRRLVRMNKFELEAFMSRVHPMISLDHDDYERLKAKIQELIQANEEACRNQGVDPSKFV